MKKTVDFFYPDIEVKGIENLPKEPCVLVGNHCQMHGPIISQIRLPGDNVTWCAGEMMNREEVADYAYRDFWSNKPKYQRPFYRGVSYLIVPISVALFRNMKTIPVYHDMRLVKTFRESVNCLKDGKNLIIFPECYDPHNHIVNDFQDKFVDVARFYYKQTGKALTFVPMYTAPKLHKVVIGKGISFNSETPIAEERTRICNYLMDAVSEMAYALPRHTVIPYANISKKKYPQNLPMEE